MGNKYENTAFTSDSGVGRIKKLENVIKKRNINAKLMDKLLVSLAPDVIIPRRIEQYRETFALYMCLVKKEIHFLKYLIKII